MDAGWFSGSRLNYAAHLLRHEGDEPALVFFGENGARRELSRDQLREEVAAIAAGLREAGVDPGDRVGGYLPNCPEAVIAMLATTSIGAIWSSCSPDFGINGVVDRFGQIEPKVLFAVNGYYYNGKTCDTRATVRGVVERLPASSALSLFRLPDVRGCGTRERPSPGGLRRPGREPRRYAVRVQSPALHHVFLGNDRRAEVHRARTWRNAAAAPARNMCCIPISAPVIGCSTSRPAAG